MIVLAIILVLVLVLIITNLCVVQQAQGLRHRASRRVQHHVGQGSSTVKLPFIERVARRVSPQGAGR